MSDAILPAFSDRGSLVRHAIAALVVIAGGAGGLVYWAASTEIAGAVVASGTSGKQISKAVATLHVSTGSRT